MSGGNPEQDFSCHQSTDPCRAKAGKVDQCRTKGKQKGLLREVL